MGRGPRPTKGKAKPAVPRKSPTDDAARVRDLEKRLAEASKREAEALARETATGEILRVISRSPTDVQPVFDALAENAARLCQSLDADIRRRDGDLLRLVAHHGSIPVSEFTLPIIGMVAGRAVLEGRTVQVADVQAESAEFRASSAVEEFRGRQIHTRPALIALCAGTTYLSAGRIDEAASHARDALVLTRRLEARGSEAHALCLAGDIASTAGADGAESSYREALTRAGELGMRPLVAHCHLGLGKLYLRTGQRGQAREHLTTATTMYREMGMTYWLEKAEAETRVLA